ncbi:MAG: hypothetical protein GY804_07460 [Alphaproteobacteria bacterium]|nr:hypothetical protein [Alphaproteobacteria bacterium]
MAKIVDFSEILIYIINNVTKKLTQKRITIMGENNSKTTEQQEMDGLWREIIEETRQLKRPSREAIIVHLNDK